MSSKVDRSVSLLELPTPLAPLNEQQRKTSLSMATTAASVAADNKGQQIAVLDMTSQTSIFDYFVIVTGQSRRQLHAIADDIARSLRQDGYERVSRSGYEESRWIVLDYGGVVVHLFDDETRDFYDLEGLWADCPRIAVAAAMGRDT